MHSPRVISTEGPSNSRHSFSPASTALILKAFTAFTFCTPMARTTASRSTRVALRSSVTAQPTPGWSWCPVMAVTLLSIRMTTPREPLCTMFTRGAMPEWKKVESPIVHTRCSGILARLMPCSTPMLAPMAPMVCWASKGGSVPRL